MRRPWVLLLLTAALPLAVWAADGLFSEALAKHDAVLGPSADGGYYLIDLNSPQSQLFGEMPWSTSRVLNETRTRLDTAGLHWHELRTLHDIDTPADLIHLPHPLKQVVSL